MQVLVALASADGAVVSRDELIERCWEGRVVGDDAINRAIGRLRRLSEADNGASFEIETIARVGYRLKQAGAAPQASPLPPAGTPNRRWLLAGGGAVAAAAAAGAGFFLLRRPDAPAALASPKVALLLEQAKLAIRAGSTEAAAQAAGMFEHVTRIAPDSAQAWGGLALANPFAMNSMPEQAEAFRLRAEDALRHARVLDPHDANGYAAEAVMIPLRGGWGRKEAIYREGLRFNPASDELLLDLADLMNNAGRNVEAADLAVRAGAHASQIDPAQLWLSIQIFWCADRLAKADAIAAQGAELFPRQRSVWFSRVYLLMFTGRQRPGYRAQPGDGAPGRGLCREHDRLRRSAGTPGRGFHGCRGPVHEPGLRDRPLAVLNRAARLYAVRTAPHAHAVLSQRPRHATRSAFRGLDGRDRAGALLARCRRHARLSARLGFRT